MRYLSLFSGIEASTVAWHPLGWEPVGFSEIEPFPCQLLEHRYPTVPNLGDVTKITEDQIKQLGSIDLVVFGAPCTDLSIAGKQQGFRDEDGNTTRSGLFFDAIRIFNYAREHGGARFALWENVPGAFSSSKGRDFAEVVGTMAGLDDVGVPKNGWGAEGAAVGENGLVEWACLDSQWRGLAQRRNRVFVILDTGDWANRPPILLERHSLRGDTPPSRETGQETSTHADEGTYACSGIGEYKSSSSSSPLRRTGADLGNGCESLITRPAVAYGIYGGNKRKDQPNGGFYAKVEDTSKTLDASGGLNPTCSQGGVAVCYEEVAKCLNAGAMGRQDYETETMVLAFAQNTRDEVRYINGDGAIAGALAAALAAETGAKQQTYLALAGNTIGRKPENGGNGNGFDDTGAMYTLTSADRHEVAIGWSEELTASVEVAGTLQRVGDGGRREGVMTPAARVRRLTPTECERLQGFEDGYTQVLFRNKPAADGNRYKALGNSMAVPVMRYIGEKIQEAVDYPLDDLI